MSIKRQIVLQGTPEGSVRTRVRRCYENVRIAALIGVRGIGVAIALWRLWSAGQPAKRSEETHANERWKTAAELFGHASAAACLGAIYDSPQMADSGSDKMRDRVANMFTSDLTYPPQFSIPEPVPEKVFMAYEPVPEEVTDYGSPDTLEIIKLLNSGKVRPPKSAFTIPDGGPYKMVNGGVTLDVSQPDYRI